MYDVRFAESVQYRFYGDIRPVCSVKNVREDVASPRGRGGATIRTFRLGSHSSGMSRFRFVSLALEI